MARSKRAHPVSPTLATLQKAVQHADTHSKGNDATDDENVADYAAHNGHHMLGEVQFEMLVAASTEYFLGLDDLRRQAVTVLDALRTRTGLDELRRDPQLLQVPLFLYSVCLEHLQKFRQRSFRQPLNVIITGKHWSIPFAKRTLQL